MPRPSAPPVADEAWLRAHGFLGSAKDAHFMTGVNWNSLHAPHLSADERARERACFARVPRSCQPPGDRPWLLSDAARREEAEAEAEAEARAKLPPFKPVNSPSRQRMPTPSRPLALPPTPPSPAYAAEDFVLLLDASRSMRRCWPALVMGVNVLLRALREFAPPGARLRLALFNHALRDFYVGDAATCREFDLTAAQCCGQAAPLDALSQALRDAPARRKVVLLLSGTPQACAPRTITSSDILALILRRLRRSGASVRHR